MPSEALKRRRADVRKRLAAGETVSAISRYHGVDRATIIRDRACLAEQEPHAGPPPPPQGNARALSHGATSELRLAPLRDEFAIELRARWPWLDDVRLAVLADRLSRLESARRWLDAQGGVVRDDQGEVYAVVDRIEKWGSRVETITTELEAEARARKTQAPSVDAYIASTQHTQHDDDTPPDADTAPSTTEDA